MPGPNEMKNRHDWADLPSQELLKYFPAYQVLICTSCRYALKPGGIVRHMKDIHHLQHEQRRPYTLYASNLKLKKPEDVSEPREEDFPMPYLPLEQGWRCEALRCDYLCVSTKRMENHWSAKHGRKGYPSNDWSPAPLQTFFRGNMLRYFTIHRGTHHDRHQPSLAVTLPYVQKMRDKYGLDAIDCLTLEHYFYSSHKSFATNGETEKIWLNVVSDLAYEHLFLLHGIIACTALHMAHLYPAQRQEYTVRAYAHQDSALPLFRDAMNRPTAQNCDAIMAFAYMLVVYTFATELDNENSLLLITNNPETSQEGEQLVLPQWLHFVRCGCSVLCDVWDKIETGPISVLANAWEHELNVGDSKFPYLDHFMSIVPQDGSWSDHVISVYQDGANALAEAFAYLDKTKTKTSVSTWYILDLWPVRLEDEFYDLIFQRHPGALILLAYYCVLMKPMDHCWYFEGRRAKLIAAITNVLDTKWHPYLQDAADQMAKPVK